MAGIEARGRMRGVVSWAQRVRRTPLSLLFFSLTELMLPLGQWRTRLIGLDAEGDQILASCDAYCAQWRSNLNFFTGKYSLGYLVASDKKDKASYPRSTIMTREKKSYRYPETSPPLPRW